MVELLERDAEFSLLHSLLGHARLGSGRVTLVRGEAGAGKTTLVRTFTDSLGDKASVLWGTCDDLIVPRPFGPLWDMATEERSIGNALRNGDREEIFGSVLDLLNRSLRPTVAVIDDLHWADEATLDLVTYLGRRVSGTSALLILAFRDETSSEQPLASVLGAMPASNAQSIHLGGLSRVSALTLHEDKAEATRIWEISAGNPFFLSELLKGEFSGPIPASIRDVMRARMNRLTPFSRQVAKLISVVPGRVEMDLIDAVQPDWRRANDDAAFRGLLEVSVEKVKFRHEVARRAVEVDLDCDERREMNARILSAMEAQDGDVSRCAHHARESSDPDAMLRHIPEAAMAASRAGSHREALAHFRAVRHLLAGMPEPHRADHYEAWAEEENKDGSGYHQAEHAVALRKELGDDQALGGSLLLASRMALWDGDVDQAARLANEAIDAVRDTGGEPLAAAYAQLSRLCFLLGDRDRAASLAETALSMADGPSPAKAQALTYLGALKALEAYPAGVGVMEQGVHIADQLGLTAIRNNGLNNISAVATRWRDPVTARSAMERLDRQVDKEEDPATAAHNRLRRASIEFVSGKYRTTASLLDLADDQNLQPRAQALKTLIHAQLEVRTSPQGQGTALDAARALAKTSEEHQFLAQVAAAAAESVFISRIQDDAVTRENIEILSLMREGSDPWNVGEPALWLWLDGHIKTLPDRCPEPLLMLGHGLWKESAEWFGDRGAPYEQAVALSRGDTPSKLQALSILDGLGAWPLASKIRIDLREAGVKGVPRGTIGSTRNNPLGLTKRQAEVLSLIGEGLSNAEIAERMFVSVRTAETHVGAVLAKLGVSSREEAGRVAIGLQAEA